MNTFLRTALMVIATVSFSGLAQGQGSPRAGEARKPTPQVAVELEAGTVTLPTSTNGTLVMKECGKCPLKSHPVTPATAYFLYDDLVSLAELTAAVADQPKAYLGVTYSPKTGEIMSVKAHAKRVR